MATLPSSPRRTTAKALAIRASLFALALAAAFNTAGLSAEAEELTLLADKERFTEWKLDVRFVNASIELDDAAIRRKIDAWVETAERVYARRPALKIQYTVDRQVTKAGQNLSQLIFPSDAAYAKFMDANFDNVAVTRTEGHLTVLISDRICTGEDKNGEPHCAGGIASFPHWTQPFSKKRGISLDSEKDGYTFAHELGHMLGLLHTFEPYRGLNLHCNDEYSPKGKPEGFCNSCANNRIVYDANNDPDSCDGRANIMDYCTSNTRQEFLNTCQEQRAANQRYRYMTADGKTDYFGLKGLAGEPICKSDGDCEEGRFCDLGAVLGVGRNQCKELKALGASCSRDGQCTSARCAGLRCASADECQADLDCGAARYCRAGLVILGQNTCEAKLADGRACTRDPQCGSGQCSEWRPQDGQVSGLCYTPASKAAGQACQIDLECRAGKCNSSKKCVCRSDSDCGSSYWCDVGIDLVDNLCKAKLDKGETCGIVGELGVGHRCKSGDCKVSGLSTKLECR